MRPYSTRGQEKPFDPLSCARHSSWKLEPPVTYVYAACRWRQNASAASRARASPVASYLLARAHFEPTFRPLLTRLLWLPG